MLRCSNGHFIRNETPAIPYENRQPCPQCGTRDRILTVHLKEELEAVDDPYNTAVRDSSHGRKIEEICRLYYQRKYATRNPGNLSYEDVLGKLKGDLGPAQLQDLKDIDRITGHLAHGNGYGALNQLNRLAVRKGHALPSNDISKGTGINSLSDIEELVQKKIRGQLGPISLTRDSDLFDGNVVWTRIGRSFYLSECREVNSMMTVKLQSLKS